MKKTFLSFLFIGASCALFAQDTTLNQTNTNANMNNNTNVNSTLNQNNTTGNNMNSSGNYNAYATSVSVPSTVQANFTRDYPTASNVMWSQQGDYYHGIYNNNGRYSHVFYNQNGSTSWTLALPITQNWVPDDIINKVSQMYGPMVYDITTLKSPVANGTAMNSGMNNSSMTTNTGNTNVTANTNVDATTGNTNTTTTTTMNNTSVNSGNTNVNGTMSTTSNNQAYGPVPGNIYQVRLLQNGQIATEWIDENGNKVTDPFRVETTMDVNSSNLNSGTSTMDNSTMNSATTTDNDVKMKVKTANPDGTKTKTKIENGKVKHKTKG